MHLMNKSAFTAVMIAAGVCWTNIEARATSPSDDAVIAVIKAANPGNDVIGFHRVYVGPIGSQTGDITVATFTTELNNGGNFSASTFGAFVERNGKVVQLANEPEPTGRVQAVAARGGHLVVTWMAFRPSDPRCCPSERHTVIYAVGRDAVTARR